MEQQAEKKIWKDKLPTLIAITTLILAACATLTAFKAGGYGNKMVLAQNQATDQWNYYQAKSIKETAYRAQRDALAAAFPADARTQAVTAQLAAFEKEISRYKSEKEAVEKEAQRLEKERDVAQKYNGVFGQGLMFLQVGILLSSLASINKIVAYWLMGAVAGIIGVAYFIYAMFIL